MSASPSCSVIIAVYNDESHIARSVLSVMNQTARAIEIIAVDDGSTDRTPAILERLAAQDSRLRLIRNTSRIERSRSRNRGIEAAQAPYVAIVDSDDVCLPDRIACQLAYMQDHPHTVALGGQLCFISPQGDLFAAPHLPTDPAVILRRLRRGNPVSQPTVMLRKEAVESVGGYDPALVYAEDYDLFWRLSQQAELNNLDRIVLLYQRSWEKEYQLYRRRRLSHLRIRLKWLRATGIQPSDLAPALAYLVSTYLPPRIGHAYRQRKYSRPAPPEFAAEAGRWLQTLADQEARLVGSAVESQED